MSKRELKERSLKEFLGEAEDLLERLNNDVFALSEDLPKGSVDPDVLNSVFRSAHTLKGISGMFGFTELNNLSHNLEDILDSLRLGKITFTQDILNLLFEGLKFIQQLLVEKKEKGEKIGSDIKKGVEGFIERLNKTVKETGSSQDDGIGGVDLSSNLLKVLTEYEEHRLKENIKQGRNLFILEVSFPLETFDKDISEIHKKIKQIGELIATLPSPESTEVDRLTFNLLFGTDKAADEIEDIADGAELRQINKESQRPSKGAEPSVGEQTGSQFVEESLRSISTTVRVDIERLNSIMNTVGELALCRSMIGRISEALKNELGFKGHIVDLFKVNRDLDRKLNELQTSLLEARMVPLKQLFDRLHRMVRKLLPECGKEIEISIKGADTELDKLIVEELADPLMHLIRNSVDHGIETPDEREAQGKPPKGHIKLEAYNRGNHVVIEVEDDGRGIDYEKIRKKIVDNGILSEEDAERLDKEQLLEYIFISGFSTKDKITDISGRGVGMDVVKMNITRLSGSIDIDSEKGKGTRFTLILPITLAIIKALLITSHGKEYAIPIASVLEILSLPKSEIKTIENKEVIDIRGRTLPLLRLNRYFNLPGTEVSNNVVNVIVIGLAENRIGILADTIIGEQDVVIKGLGGILKSAKGIAGAADLGNQKTILVLDAGGIILSVLRGSAKHEALEEAK